MPTHQETEAEVLATLQAMLRLWEARSVEANEAFFAAYVTEGFTGFGTGQGEYFSGRDDFRARTRRDAEDMPHPITFTATWVNVRVLHPALALAEGELRLDVHTAPDAHVLRLRSTFLFERQDDRWRLLHFHLSRPNATQNEGDALLELFMARNRELERQVVLRTAELEQSLVELKATQAQLVQQAKMASLGALTAGVAHEIKNPLNFVNNFAALSRELVDELAQEIEAGAEPTAIRAILSDLSRNAEKIEAHGRRADGIVRSMLEHARGGGGERRATDLNALVLEHVELAWHGKRTRTAELDVRVTKDLDAAVGQVEVVPQDIGRVVLNLLGNAFDAVCERAGQDGAPYHPAITVTTRRVDGRVVLRVEDNGPGVPEALRARVFEPFFTTKPTGQGTGLGLSLSYDIVTQGHGGTLGVESRPGSGAAFVVSLPAKAMPTPTAAPA